MICIDVNASEKNEKQDVYEVIFRGRFRVLIVFYTQIRAILIGILGIIPTNGQICITPKLDNGNSGVYFLM